MTIKKKSKKKIIKTKMKPCPCPDHAGKKLPATSEYWHKGGNPDGFQGYCKKWRNKSQNVANKAARKAAKKAVKKIAQKKVGRNQQKLKSKNRAKFMKARAEILPTRVLCKNNHWATKETDFQSNGKGGFRQPCKECIAKKRAELKKKVDRDVNPEYKEPAL